MHQYTSAITKRSVVVAGHKTSVSLEDAFWQELKNIAFQDTKQTSDLVAEIDKGRSGNNLSSAIRLYILERYTRPH